MNENEKLLKAIETVGLSQFAGQLQSLAKPSIRLKTRPTEGQSLPAGHSKIGGRPGLPENLDWPLWTAKDVPLSFIAQINLKDAAPYDVQQLLPHAGLLYFFYEAEEQPWGFGPADRGSSKVLFYEGSLDAVRPCEEEATFPECAVTFSSELTMPPWDSPLIEALGLPEGEEYSDLLEELSSE